MNIVSVWGGGVGLPETVALAAIAVIGYVFGRRGRPRGDSAGDSAEGVVRAAEVARQLESVASGLRADLAAHRAEVERFKRVINDAGEAPADGSLDALRDEAERVLEPTLRLVARVASAYDQIRRQSAALAQIGGGRTDPQTGLGNGRALGELVRVELAGHEATGGVLSVAILSVPAGPAADAAEQGRRLVQAAELLQPQLRDTDVLTRYGLDELVVVTPHTRLYGACVFARRAMGLLADAGLVTSCGLAQSAPGDTAATLLGRADSALYSARAKAPGSRFLHYGRAIREDRPPAESPPGAELATAAG